MWQRRRGQSLVEMALVLPVLLTLVFGIAEFGWYIYNYSALENAARRGSEQAIKEPPLAANAATSSDPCVAEIRRQARLNLVLIDLPDSEITVSYPNSGENRELGSQIEVRVQHTGLFLTPVASIFGSETFRLDFRSRRSILNTMVFDATARCP